MEPVSTWIQALSVDALKIWRFARPRKPLLRRAAVGGRRAGDCVGTCKHGHRHPPALAMLRIAAASSGHGSPPFRRDTELHGKVPCWLDGWTIGYWSSHFPWDSVSREAGFRVGWRRCTASQRRGRGRMRACTQIRPWPAERGRSPAPSPASVVARQRIQPTEGYSARTRCSSPSELTGPSAQRSTIDFG